MMNIQQVSNNNKPKKSKWLLILLVVLPVLVGAFFLFRNNLSWPLALTSPTPVMRLSSTIQTSGWQTWQDDDLSISFKYPSEWFLEDIKYGINSFSAFAGITNKNVRQREGGCIDPGVLSINFSRNGDENISNFTLVGSFINSNNIEIKKYSPKPTTDAQKEEARKYALSTREDCGLKNYLYEAGFNGNKYYISVNGRDASEEEYLMAEEIVNSLNFWEPHQHEIVAIFQDYQQGLTFLNNLNTKYKWNIAIKEKNKAANQIKITVPSDEMAPILFELKSTSFVKSAELIK
jgi:hypothetical protein